MELERTRDKIIIKSAELDQLVKDAIKAKYPNRVIDGPIKYQSGRGDDDLTAYCWFKLENE